MMNEGKQIFLLADSIDGNLTSMREVVNAFKEYAGLVDELLSAPPDIIRSGYVSDRLESIQSVFWVSMGMLECILKEMKSDVDKGFKASKEFKEE